MDKKEYYNEPEEMDVKEPECSSHRKPKCNAGSVKARTLTECSGQDIKPTGTKMPLVAKIPVVIAEKEVQIDVEATIELEKPAIEIKRIKKDLFLTQCKLIPMVGMKHEDGNKFGKLFLAGFIRKNIEFATADCVEEGVVSGEIKHTTVDVPFECVTAIEFDVPPVIRTRATTKEIELFKDNNNCDCECDEGVLSKVMCEQNFEDSIGFTEKPFCELEEVKIFEVDIHKDDCHMEHKHPKVKTFKNVVEKMVVFVTIKVLQVQQVKIDC
ncbi:MAG: hypothetical protein Q8936_09075 [Bacillota bacterium]|nr:hypothetical protein [Bacillota bacterium]